MIAAEKPTKLFELCETLWSEGAKGVLISGGCDRNGRINLAPFYESLARIKRETDLIINLHTGLLDYDDVSKIASNGIDVVSFDLVGDPSVISNVYNLKHEPKDYYDCILSLQDAKVSVVPHICIGLNEGSISGELDAVKMLKPFQPGRLIFIIFIPTRGTKMSNAKPPAVEMVSEVIKTARAVLPSTELLLGCMRPRRPERYELSAVESGIDGLVLPSAETLRLLQDKGYAIEKHEQCCAV
jgi:uncharacterized radical SAM superfamily protein